MNDIDLKKRAEELQLTLHLQLQQLKNESQVYILGGGIALVTGLIAYGLVRRRKKRKKNKRIKAAADYTPVHLEPQMERKRRKPASRSSGLLSNIKRRLFFSLLSYGQAKLVEEMNRRRRSS